MYLKAGLPVKAAQLVGTVHTLSSSDSLVQSVANSLLKGEFYEAAGDLFQQLDDNHKALDCYKKGNTFSRGKCTLKVLVFNISC